MAARYHPRLVARPCVVGLHLAAHHAVAADRRGRTPVRRLWVALIGWNGGTAALWLGLAGWRIGQSGPGRFWLITAFGTMYAGVVLRVLVKGDRA
jgi:hypothetical protein